MSHSVSMKTPLLAWTTLEEISTDIKMAPSYPDKCGRCIVLINMSPYSLEQIAAKTNQIVKRLQPLTDFKIKLQCFTVIQTVKTLRANSDKQRNKITRCFHCCEWSTFKLLALEKTLMEERLEDESGPAIPLEEQG